MQRTTAVHGGVGGSWILRDSVERDLLCSRRRMGEPFASEMRRIAASCACCHRLFQSDSVERLVCRGCGAHCTCSRCGQRFAPSSRSFGRACPSCWKQATDFNHLAQELAAHSRASVLRDLDALVWGDKPCSAA